MDKINRTASSERREQTARVHLSLNAPSVTTIDGKEGEHGMDLFYASVNLTSVCSDSMEGGIGYKAFFTCRKLKSVSFPLMTSAVSRYAFSGCHSLQRVSIPKITKILPFAFAPCFNLRHVDLHPKVKTAKNAFFRCHILTVFASVSGFDVEIVEYLHWRCAFDVNKEVFKTVILMQELCDKENVKKPGTMRATPVCPIMTFLTDKGRDLTCLVLSFKLGEKRGLGDLRYEPKDVLAQIARSRGLVNSSNEEFWQT